MEWAEVPPPVRLDRLPVMRRKRLGEFLARRASTWSNRPWAAERKPRDSGRTSWASRATSRSTSAIVAWARKLRETSGRSLISIRREILERWIPLSLRRCVVWLVLEARLLVDRAISALRLDREQALSVSEQLA